jgi:hypothetical protein
MILDKIELKASKWLLKLRMKNRGIITVIVTGNTSENKALTNNFTKSPL